MYRFSSLCIGRLMLGIRNLPVNYGFVGNIFLTQFCHTRNKCDLTTERIAITDDGSVVVCWHPEKPFPYECSKPIPEVACQQNSVLNIQNVSQVYGIFKPKKEELVREELMKITYTTKHIWFPKSRAKYKKRISSPDREYL